MKRLLLPVLFLSQMLAAQDFSIKTLDIPDKLVRTTDPDPRTKVSPYILLGENDKGNLVLYDITEFNGVPGKSTLRYLKTANHHYIVSTQEDNKAEKATTYFTELTNEGRIAGKAVQVEQHYHKEPAGYKVYTMGSNRDRRGLFVSDDTTKLALITYNTFDDEKGNEKFTATVFDENLKQLWQKEITLNVEDKINKTFDCRVTNNGGLVLISEVERQGKFDKKNQTAWFLKVWSVTTGGIVQGSEIDLGAKIVPSDYEIAEIGNNKMLMAGFYHSYTKGESYSSVIYEPMIGTYTIKIDCGSASISAKHQPFTEATKTTLSKPVNVGNNTKLMPSWHVSVTGMFKSNKDEIVMVASSLQTYRVFFLFDDNFDVKKETLIENKFRYNSGSSGTFIWNTGDNLILIYNYDQPKYGCTALVMDFQGNEIKKSDLPIPKGYELLPDLCSRISSNKIATQIATGVEVSGQAHYKHAIITLK